MTPKPISGELLAEVRERTKFLHQTHGDEYTSEIHHAACDLSLLLEHIDALEQALKVYADRDFYGYYNIPDGVQVSFITAELYKIEPWQKDKGQIAREALSVIPDELKEGV